MDWAYALMRGVKDNDLCLAIKSSGSLKLNLDQCKNDLRFICKAGSEKFLPEPKVVQLEKETDVTWEVGTLLHTSIEDKWQCRV